jgi:HAD superfamily phosphoserine phosphatase-like hydrolase
MMASWAKARVVLGTATPSAESYYNAQQGKYHLVELKQRYRDLKLPHINVVNTQDLRRRKIMRGLLSPQLEQAGRQALERGERVVVLSASIDRWVQACLNQFIDDTTHFKVLGTQIEVANGRLTGKFSTLNCYGSEKVRRLKEWLESEKVGTKGALEMIAYGDSRGDKELLAMAKESHYKPFR